MKKNQKGFSLEVIILAVVIVIIAGVAITLAATHHRKNKSNLNTPTTSSQSTKQSSASSQSKASPTVSSQSAPQKPTFEFVSTDSWATHQSPDSTFSVKFGDSVSWAYCDSADVIMVGMLDINYDLKTHALKCSSVAGAIQAASPAYTYIAFGVATSLPTMPAGTPSFDYQMSDGTPMTRYSYTDSAGGISYDNIVYAADKNGSKFLAWRRMPTGHDYSPNDNFETIVHKTWTIN